MLNSLLGRQQGARPPSCGKHASTHLTNGRMRWKRLAFSEEIIFRYMPRLQRTNLALLPRRHDLRSMPVLSEHVMEQPRNTLANHSSSRCNLHQAYLLQSSSKFNIDYMSLKNILWHQIWSQSPNPTRFSYSRGLETTSNASSPCDETDCTTAASACGTRRAA